MRCCGVQTMRPPALRLSLDELIIDSFAGGGGASTGIEMATGRSPDIAINHDAEALVMHAANHPSTKHYQENVWDVDPVTACDGRPVGLAWFSPDCTFHSKARGGKPHRDRNKARRRRGLAWVVVRWAKAVRPRVIALENVEEFEAWGPLLDDGTPCPDRKGLTFRRWVKQLENIGYRVEWRQLKAADHGAPTTRKRLFVVARCDGQSIQWPEPTHGPDRAQPWRTAAECIDWSIPTPSIFERKRPLAENTLKRIARGIRRYVIETGAPFIVPMRGTHPSQFIHHPLTQPLSTITSGGIHHALVSPTLIQTGYGERKGQSPRTLDLHHPLGTVVAGGVKHALVTAFLAKHYGGVTGHGVERPFGTITTKDHHSVVEARLGDPGAETTPQLHLPGMTDHREDVRAFLLAYYGSDQDTPLSDPLHTITTKHRFGLVTVHGREYVITDIGMRMLQPRELYTAQGFPPEYIIDHGPDGARLTKTAQVRMCGNSVAPPAAAAIVAANTTAVASEAAA